LSLTTGVDTLTGGANNDTFTADNTGTTSTFTAADTLNGGAGTDSLTIYGTNTVTVANMSNIENVTVDSMGAGTTWNFSTISGINSLTNSRAVGASTVTVADGVAVTLSKNAADTLQTVNFGSTDTTASLTLNTVSAATGNVTQTGAAVATLNIATTGGASSVGTLTTGATAKTVNVTGNQNLTIAGTAGGLVADGAKLDATNFTGKLSVVLGDGAAGTSNDVPGMTVIGGTNDDTVDMRASTAGDYVTITAGAGNDTVKVTNAQITGGTTVKATGGDGTDTLVIDFGDTTATQATDLSGVITGFEKISVLSTVTVPGANTATLAMGTNKLGISDIAWDGNAADSFTVTGLAANSTLRMNTNAVTTSAAIGTDTTADTINLVLDGYTTAGGGSVTLTNYETVNLTSQKDSAGNTNSLAVGGLVATSATALNISGSGALVGGTIQVAATAAVNASAYTGDLTATTFTAMKSYSGGSGKDEITLADGDLKQGNTFAGGAGTDKLTVAATANQDMGILALTGFETVALTSHDDVAVNLTKADLRNVTDLSTLTIASGNGGNDQFTLNRLSADTTLNFGSDTGAVVTTLNSGTTQKIAFGGNFTAASVTLDSGTTTLTVTSSDGNTTEDQAGGVFTSLSGTSLATINLDGLDRTDLGTLGTTVTKVDASASKGGLTVTASATATNIIGSQAADAITGGGAADTIQGGKGDDVIDGGAGADSYVFEATAANNGSDSIAMVAGAGGDVLNFKNFMSAGSVDQNGGTGTAVVAYAAANNADVNITNKVAIFDTNGAVLNAAGLVAEIQGAGNAFAITSGGKAIVITGDASAPANEANIFFIDDTLDGVSGTISATDVVVVGVTNTGGAFDVDTLITTNFAFA